jgi:hypothetical protein
MLRRRKRDCREPSAIDCSSQMSLRSWLDEDQDGLIVSIASFSRQADIRQSLHKPLELSFSPGRIYQRSIQN